MSPRRTRQLMILLTMCIWGSAGLVLYWGWMPGPDPPESDRQVQVSVSSETVKAEESPVADSDRLTIESFSSLWDRPLRRELYDPPPPPKPKPPPKQAPPKVQAKLLATMIESGEKTAMIQLARGQVVFRKEGELVSSENQEATVAKITPGLMVIRQGEYETEYAIDGQGTR